jgi:hypothetical protein
MDDEPVKGRRLQLSPELTEQLMSLSSDERRRQIQELLERDGEEVEVDESNDGWVYYAPLDPDSTPGEDSTSG